MQIACLGHDIVVVKPTNFPVSCRSNTRWPKKERNTETFWKDLETFSSSIYKLVTLVTLQRNKNIFKIHIVSQ